MKGGGGESLTDGSEEMVAGPGRPDCAWEVKGVSSLEGSPSEEWTTSAPWCTRRRDLDHLCAAASGCRARPSLRGPSLGARERGRRSLRSTLWPGGACERRLRRVRVGCPVWGGSPSQRRRWGQRWGGRGGRLTGTRRRKSCTPGMTVLRGARGQCWEAREEKRKRTRVPQCQSRGPSHPAGSPSRKRPGRSAGSGAPPTCPAEGWVRQQRALHLLLRLPRG